MGGGFFKKKVNFSTFTKVESHNACELYFSKMAAVFSKKHHFFYVCKNRNSQCLRSLVFENCPKMFWGGHFLLFGKSKFTMPVKFNVWKVKIHNAYKL